MEIGGRWSEEAWTFLSLLAEARAKQGPKAMLALFSSIILAVLEVDYIFRYTQSDVGNVDIIDDSISMSGTVQLLNTFALENCSE